MRRRNNDTEDVSLDSLLDTMTNVVAILVILLIVTQLGVSDAVKRIAAKNPVDPEQVAATRKSVERKRGRLETLKALAESTPDSPVEIGNQLKSTRVDIENVRKKIKQSETEEKRLLLLATAQAEQKSKLEELTRLNEEIQSKLSEIQKIEAQLEKIPVRSAIPTRVVNLPNPRPAPRGAKPFLMLIRNQRVYPLDFEYFRAQAESRALEIIDRLKLNRDPRKGIDAGKFLTAFNRKKLRDKFFEVTMKANGPTPVLVFQPIANKGFDHRLLTNRLGPFHRSLASMNPQQFYISFLVWADSFETYLLARQACSQHGLAAGWAPQSTPRPYERNLGGKLRFGPPPPPPKIDPNKPKPKPNPNPKPVPIDTID